MKTKWTITAPSDNYSSEETFDTYEDAYQYCIEQEVIYYNRAMEYLSEHDWSLRESAELASSLGYELKNITSELLATIHLQDYYINSITNLKYYELLIIPLFFYYAIFSNGHYINM